MTKKKKILNRIPIPQVSLLGFICGWLVHWRFLLFLFKKNKKLYINNFNFIICLKLTITSQRAADFTLCRFVVVISLLSLAKHSFQAATHELLNKLFLLK
jgi:hypothetical protein